MKQFLSLAIVFLSLSSGVQAQESTRWGDYKTTPSGPLNKWTSVYSLSEKVNGLSDNTMRFGLQSVYTTSPVKKITINEYKTDYRFNDGMLAVMNKETGKWGFYDVEGTLLTGGFKWKSCNEYLPPVFSNGATIVGSNGSWFVLKKNGATIKLAAENIVEGFPFNNKGIAAVKAGGLWGSWKLFNTSGQRVFPNISVTSDGGLGAGDIEGSPIGDFNNGWARIHLSQGEFTFINESGKTMSAKFTYADHFSEGLAAVAVRADNGLRWGFINTAGEWAIKPKFSNKPCRFSNGYSVVKKANGMMCFVNRQGEQVGEETNFYTNFVNGYAFAATRTKAWIVDKDLNKLTLPSGGVNKIKAEDVDHLTRVLPVKTVFGGRYIVSYEVYGGHKENRLFDSVSGIVYQMYGVRNGSDFHFKSISDRCHVTVDRSIDGSPKKEWEGFLNEEGKLYLVFDKEEF